MIRKATDSDSHVLAEMAVQMWAKEIKKLKL